MIFYHIGDSFSLRDLLMLAHLLICHAAELAEGDPSFVKQFLWSLGFDGMIDMAGMADEEGGGGAAARCHFLSQTAKISFFNALLSDAAHVLWWGLSDDVTIPVQTQPWSRSCLRLGYWWIVGEIWGLSKESSLKMDSFLNSIPRLFSVFLAENIAVCCGLLSDPPPPQTGHNLKGKSQNGTLIPNHIKSLTEKHKRTKNLGGVDGPNRSLCTLATWLREPWRRSRLGSPSHSAGN